MAKYWRLVSAVTTDTFRLGCMGAWSVFITLVSIVIFTLDYHSPFIRAPFLRWLDSFTDLPNRLILLDILVFVFGPVAGAYIKVVRRQLAAAAWKRSMPRPPIPPRPIPSRPQGCSVVLLTVGTPVLVLVLVFVLTLQYDSWSWPLPTRITCRGSAPFGAPNPAGAQPAHTGIDLCKPPGTPITAVAGGVVEWAGWWPPESEPLGSGHGLTVWVYHGLGDDRRPVYSVYGHASVLKVRPGQPVLRGQTVALVGDTGYGIGPHLHFAVARQPPQAKQWRTGIEWEDPLNYLGNGVFTANIRLYNLFMAPVIGIGGMVVLASAWRWGARRAGAVFVRPGLRIRMAVTAQYMANNWDYLSTGYTLMLMRLFGVLVMLAVAGVLRVLIRDPTLWIQAATTVHNRFLAVLALLLLLYLLVKRLPFTGAMLLLLMMLVTGGLLVAKLGVEALVVVGLVGLALWLFMPRLPALLAGFLPFYMVLFLSATVLAMLLVGFVWAQVGPLFTLLSVIFVLSITRGLKTIQQVKEGKTPKFWESRAVLTGITLLAVGAVAAQMTVPPAGRLAPFFPPTVRRWEADITRWANTYALDPNAVATIMTIESCGWADVTSRAGATGLFQVMPFHFASGEDTYDPDTNAQTGLNFYTHLLKAAEGDVGKALAAYNGGRGGTRGPMSTWPAETRAYYRWGTGIYSEASAGLTESLTLEMWLRAGGSSLCAGRVGR